ncbi:hypothetical protein D3C81_1481360 [compost metagenome]
MHFDAIEPGLPGILGGEFVLLDDSGNFRGLKRARHRYLDKTFLGIRAALSLDGRGCDRRFAIGLQLDTGKTPDVPQLADDFSAGRVHRIGDLFPPGDLRLRPDARRHRIATSLSGNVRRLGDDQTCTRTLSVVSRMHFIRYAVVGHPAARHGGHDNSIGQLQRAHLHGRKKVGINSVINHKHSYSIDRSSSKATQKKRPCASGRALVIGAVSNVRGRRLKAHTSAAG